MCDNKKQSWAGQCKLYVFLCPTLGSANTSRTCRASNLLYLVCQDWSIFGGKNRKKWRLVKQSLHAIFTLAALGQCNLAERSSLIMYWEERGRHHTDHTPGQGAGSVWSDQCQDGLTKNLLTSDGPPSVWVPVQCCCHLTTPLPPPPPCQEQPVMTLKFKPVYLVSLLRDNSTNYQWATHKHLTPSHTLSSLDTTTPSSRWI